MRRLLRRTAWIGRLVLALGLLAVLFFGTRAGIERSTQAIDRKRLEDRVTVAEVLADPVGRWLGAGETDARRLADAVAARGAGAGLAEFIGRPRDFASDAIVLDRSMRVVDGTGRFDVLRSRIAEPCTIVVQETGERLTDGGLSELVGAVQPSGPPLISRVLVVPGECATPSVAVAAASGPRTVVVVVAPVADAFLGVDFAPLNRPDDERGTRIFVVDPARNAIEPAGGPRTAPSRVASLIDGAAEDPTRRYLLGEGGNVERIGSALALPGGWWFVFEQDAGSFDLPPQERPSTIVASLLVIVFGVVFALITFFDIRRRRAHRRAEVAKNAFFSVAGHELRTPLTSLKGFLETLAARWDDVGDEQKKLIVDRMLPQSRRLDRLVERLLVASSIQAETHTHPQVAPTDVTEIVAQVVEEYLAEAPLHELTVKAKEPLPQAQADPNALRQVLQHLLDNAIKYSPQGGPVRVLCWSSKRALHIAVEDEGVGLPSDHRHIFDPLVQGESVTKRVHDEGGVGLGLFIVRTLVREMGGTVRAEPRETGARFVVTLRSAGTPARATTG